MTDQAAGTGSKAGPAFYARSGGRAADWWTLLHPPYTVWHLSYAVLGAAVAPHRDWVALAATVLAFFLAVGVAAHALDELNGRPLDTAISDQVLWVAAVLGLAGAAALGMAGVAWGAWALALFVPVGVVVVLGYNLELFAGRLHTDVGFAVWWGGFPVVVGYVAQQPPLDWTQLVAAGGVTAAAAGTAYAQRILSTPARRL
ncbi:MAG: hypothetical protein H0U28_00055, partial [Nocardioidaceae bacterium]|nr:hypothetical protein [Nocardioidaceae bacterium]